MADESSRKWRGWWLAPLLLVALVVTLVPLMSWNILKPLIIERAEEATGRSVAIEGDITIDFLPRPGVSLHDITIGNPEWARSSFLLEAQRLSVTPSLAALFNGELAVDAVELAGPILSLEQRQDAPGNWVFQNTRDEESEPPPDGDGTSVLPITIRQFSLVDARVSYWAPHTESPVALTIPSLQIARDNETMHTQGALVYIDRRFELEAQTDSLQALLDSTSPFGGEITLTADDDRLEGTFTLPELPSLTPLQADAKFSVASTADWADWLGLPGVELGSLALTTRLERAGNEWQFREIDASALDSRVNGELSVEATEETPRLNGRLHATEIDLAAWREALPEGEKTQGMAIPVLPDLRGELALSTDRLVLQQRVLENALENLSAKVHLAEHSLKLAPVTFDVAGGKIEASADLASSPETLSAEAQISLQALDMEALGIESRGIAEQGGTLAGDVGLRLPPLEQRPAFALDTLLANLAIDNGRFSYRNQQAKSHLDIRLASGEAPPLRLGVTGTFRDKPLTLEVEGDSLPGLVALKEEYRFEAEATSGNLRARADTTLASLLNPATLAGEVMLQAPDARDLEAWVGPVLPPLPEFRLVGRLERENERWSASELKGEIGGARVAGSVTFRNTERPNVQADFEAGRISLARLLPESTGAETNEEPADDSLLAPLRGFDGQLALRADSLVLPAGTVLSGLELSAGLDEGRLDVEPLRFGLADGVVTSRLVMDTNGQVASGSLDTVIDNMSLATLADNFTPVEERLGRLSADLHLEMSETLPVDRRENVLLPFIGRMIFEPSTLHFENPQADTDLTLTLETRGLEDDHRRFHVEGDGRYDSDPVTLSMVGDPLLNARHPTQPYAVDLEVDVVGSRLALQGTLLRPMALEGLDLELALEGPNPQRLSRLLGVALPQLPPYSVSGSLNLDDQRWTLDNMEGDIGDSDLDGRLSLDGGAKPPKLSGELHSASLDIADLGVLIGATEEQESQDRFILPDTPLIGEGWQDLSAEVRYQGESVRAGSVPLSEVVIDFRLEDGHGRFEPVSFGIGEGHIDLVLDLNAGSEPPGGSMQVEMRRVDLNDVLRQWNLADESVGVVGGRGKFWIEGRSIAELLASADGGLLLLMTGGRLDAMLVELAGLDASQAFFSWVRGREPIPIDCLYADLQARDGVSKLDTFVIDTLDTTFTAGGEVDLNTERLDISLFAHPKDPSVFTGRAPFHLGGTFNDIETGVHGGGLGLRAGASAALGALGGHIAALLPLLEVGAGPDMAYCDGLVERSREAVRDEEASP
ncbi:AsmA family protein [Vreelandella massiliensis]|uniref:AsmA family protein n=1 Tax=Vreelandella massiliensis TaxID=1816686 RepID=UPI00096AB270|nr:AsmA family protein [Halomonas massiliensis]